MQRLFVPFLKTLRWYPSHTIQSSADPWNILIICHYSGRHMNSKISRWPRDLIYLCVSIATNIFNSFHMGNTEVSYFLPDLQLFQGCLVTTSYCPSTSSHLWISSPGSSMPFHNDLWPFSSFICKISKTDCSEKMPLSFIACVNS